jgi:hypothetical protein
VKSMPQKSERPGALWAAAGPSGLHIPRQETQPDLKPNTPSFSSAFEFVAVDAVRFVSARYGLLPSFAAVVARCAGIGGGS